MTDARVSSRRAGEYTSSSLLELARRQDALAWARLIELYGPLVWRWCRRCGLGAADIEDVCQEVFRAVHRALPRFRRERNGSFRAWLRVITQNKLRSHWRGPKVAQGAGGSEAAARLDALPDPAEGPSSAADDDQELGILYRRAVELIRHEFADGTWQAFWRAAIEDEPVKDVAAALGMTANAVYLARSRVRRRLRELLDDSEEGLAD